MATISGGNATNNTNLFISSAAASVVAAGVINAINASGVTVATYSGSGSLPSGSSVIALTSAPASALTIPSGSSVSVIVSTAPGQTNLTNPNSVATTVVAGSGGLVYTQSATSVAGGLIVAGGGSSNIQLAAGANTVNLDIGQGATSTVNAGAGGAAITVNNDGPTSNALLLAGKSDSISIAGSAFVFLNDTTSAVSIAAGGAGFFGNAGGASSIALAAGNETVGAVSGATESISGASGASTAAIYIAGNPQLTGSLIINPVSQNVTIFAGAGATTLFSGAGSDVALGATGFLTAGTGGGSLLVSATSVTGAATTLVGGGAGDALYAQSTNVSLKGAAGTAVLDAAGVTVSGGTTKIGNGSISTSGAPTGLVFSVGGASGGDTLNAGASNAAIFGATSGANTIISGTGNATAFGYSGATSGAGNTYLDGGVGSLTIADFSASDTFKLTGSVSVASAAASGGGTLVTLSDGTKITVFGGVVTTTNYTTYFHS